MIFVEMCAGMGAVTMWLHQQQAPCSRIGSKTGYAASIAHHMGLPPASEIESIWLIEADFALANAIQWLYHHPVALADAVELAAVGEPRAVWMWSCHRASHPVPDTAEDAAHWWLCTAGSRGGIGGFKGAHKLRPSVDGFIPSRESLVKRIREFKPITVQVLGMDARQFVTPSDATIYLDPPYQGAQGYGPELPRADVIRLAKRWRQKGCRVGVSEREPLDIEGARHVELTYVRKGQYRRSLTRSHAEWLTILD